MTEENILIKKLNEFRKKYYKNSAIKGGLISIGILITLFLAETILEYYGYFPAPARIFLFYFYLSVAFFSVLFLVIVPVLRIFNIGKTISYEEAAIIIGNHFEEIQDKLLNTLQLMEKKRENQQHVDLLIAGIEQRIRTLKIVSFKRVINLQKNTRYLKIAIPPLLLLGLIMVISPKTISEPLKRIIRYNKTFQEPAPFRIVILNKGLLALQQEDFLLKVKLVGDEIPEEIYVQTGDNICRMQKDNIVNYSFLFKDLQRNLKFRIIAGKIQSEEFEVAVYPKPIILNFETSMAYPAYTGKQNETLNNIGDLVVPEGTCVSWKFFTKDVEEMRLNLAGKILSKRKEGSNVFEFSEKLFETLPYRVMQNNHYTQKSDSLNYKISVIKDAFPEINVEEARDTAVNNIFFFKCTIKDDYGFTKLQFNLLRKSEEDTDFTVIKIENIPVDRKTASQICFYSMDMSAGMQKPGDKFSYFFEIWDNDGIHGPKSTRTKSLFVEIPSIEKISENTDKNARRIQNALKDNISASKEITKQIDDINKRMIEQNDLTWKEKKKIEEIVNDNERIQKNIEKLKKSNLQNIENEKKYLQTGERILHKQQKLNELADQLLSSEMKKSVEEMKKLLETMDKQKLNDLLPKIKNSTEELERQLDRSLELFKQLEFERKLEKNIGDLKRLADEQKQLSEKTGNQEGKHEDLSREQEKIQEKFDTIKKGIGELQKEEKEIETAPDLGQTKEKQNSISEKLTRSEKLMKSGKSSETSQNQKKTSEEIEELSQQLEELMSEAENENQDEDAQELILLTQKLNKLSFEQEEIIARTSTINRNDPKYVELINDEKEIGEKFKNIEDTLNIIAKRQIMLGNIILGEVKKVNENVTDAIEEFVERRVPSALAEQQFAMTSLNNLAVMLDEAIQQMNESSNPDKMSNGQKSCKRPNKAGGKQSMKTMRQMQQNLSKQLQDMKDMMGKAKDGKSPDRSEQEGENKEIAKMVAEQEAIREQLQEYENGLKEEGIKDNGDLNQLKKDMEKNETDILNKSLNQETFSRQQRIISRMLESEKSEQLREKEEKRESNEGNDRLVNNPEHDLKMLKGSRGTKDVLNMAPIPVNYYFKTKAGQYILKVNK